MGPIRKRDWGGRRGCSLKTKVLHYNFFLTPALQMRTFWLLAILCALLYNIIFNTGALQWAK